MNRLDRPRQFLGIAVAALAGYVDAVGYLSADRFFVSFMSGNTTRMAADLVRGRPAGLTALGLIVGFIVGVALGNLAAHAAGPRRKPAVLGLVTLLLALSAALGTIGGSGVRLAMLVLAMGALNNTLRAGEAPVALTYMTGALVRIGQALSCLVRGQRPEGFSSWIALWLALAGGAALGVALQLRAAEVSLILPILVGIGLTVASTRLVAR